MSGPNTSLLRAVHFSSEGVPAAEQFDAWRSFVGGAADISLERSEAVGFKSEVDVWGLGGMAFLKASLPGKGYQRRYRKRRKDPIDHWCLLLTGEPNGHGRLKLRPLARDFDHASDDPRMLALYVSRDLFPDLAADFDALPTDLPRSGLFGLVADHLVSLMRNLPLVEAGQEAAIVSMTRPLVAAMISSSTGKLEDAEPAIAHLLRERVRQYIQRNLGSPHLAPDTICRDVGISRSRLYRMFEDLGGVADYIKRQRLLKSMAALSVIADMNDLQSVRDIAESLAFADPSSFSRAFKAEFLITPTEAREAAMAGDPFHPIADLGEPADFNQLLRRLRA